MKTFVAFSALLAAAPALAAPTEIYSNNFTAPATGVSATVTGGGSVVADGTGGGISGNYFRNDGIGSTTTWTFSGLAAHSSIDVNFTLAFIDSWDGPGNSNPIGDYLDLLIDGNVVATLSVYNFNYDAVTPDLDGATPTANGFFFYNGSFQDRVVDASTIGALSFAHTGSSFTLGIRGYGTGYQGGNDESWGIDNLSVSAELVDGAVPEPATWAMLLTGFGIVGGALRRRPRALATA